MRQYRRRRKVASGQTKSIAVAGGGTEPLIVRTPASYPVPVAPIDPGRAIREWAATLVISDGLLAGKHFDVADWQLAFLRDALSPGVREAGLSVGRKNGKPALAGATFVVVSGGDAALPSVARNCRSLHRRAQ